MQYPMKRTDLLQMYHWLLLIARQKLPVTSFATMLGKAGTCAGDDLTRLSTTAADNQPWQCKGSSCAGKAETLCLEARQATHER